MSARKIRILLVDLAEDDWDLVRVELGKLTRDRRGVPISFEFVSKSSLDFNNRIYRVG